MATKANIQEYTTQLLDMRSQNARYRATGRIAVRSSLWLRLMCITLVNTVVDEMDLNVRTDESLVDDYEDHHRDRRFVEVSGITTDWRS